MPMNSIEPRGARRTLLRIAFVLGPALLLLAALVYRLGIGLLPPGNTSHVEGVLGSYALALFVPIYLYLSGRLAATNRTLGAITTSTGLFGAVAGFAMMYTRVLEQDLRARGAGDELWASFYHGPSGEYLAVALLGPLFPLTSIFLGIGFLRSRTLPAWAASALVIAGISFPLGQVLEWNVGLAIFYPLACLLWAIALPAAGAHLLGRDGDRVG